MIITEVKAYPVSAKAETRITGYTSSHEDVSKLISQSFRAAYVKVETDDGTVGWGEAIVREGGLATADIVNNLFRPVLLGQNPLNTEVLWNKMFSMMRLRGHSYGFFVEALSGVDMALWDVKGKSLGLPVYALLGGKYRDSVKSYLSSIVYKDSESIGKEASQWVDKGFRQIKLKIGRGFEEDSRAVKAFRDSVGYDVQLMVDANTAYNPTSAIKVGRMLEKYDVSWFEEPITPDNLEGYKEVCRALDVPVCGAETFFTKHQWKSFIAGNAVDIVQPDVARVGGITECRKILSLAEAYGKPVTFHVGLSGFGARAAGLHFSANTPPDMFLNYEYYYFDNPLVSRLLRHPIEVMVGDMVKVPEGNGLGLDVNEEAVRAFCEKPAVP
ncbi:MAG: mandelate racemase/muconate lactonizing enzyme family protein [Thermoprotei archaeon]